MIITKKSTPDEFKNVIEEFFNRLKEEANPDAKKSSKSGSRRLEVIFSDVMSQIRC